MDGLINLHKPSGMTSRDAVNKVQRLVRPAKVGHTGTLDPLASGVLVVTVGKATRLAEYVQRMPKSYLASFQLGKSSDTEDITGNVQDLSDPPRPGQDALQQALPIFVGDIMQRPPAHSALKVQGQRAYKLAREGRDVRLEPRPIRIFELEIVHYAYPQLDLQIRCGSGTYVRSLGRDLARSVGTEAVMSSLVRTAVGGFRIEDAAGPEQLQTDLPKYVLPMETAVGPMQRITLAESELGQIGFGHTIRHGHAGDSQIAAFTPSGQLAAILVRRDGGYGPQRNFVARNA